MKWYLFFIILFSLTSGIVFFISYPQKITHGIITQHKYYPGHDYTVSHYPSFIPETHHVDDEWYVYIQGDKDSGSGWVLVTEETYRRFKNGEHICLK